MTIQDDVLDLHVADDPLARGLPRDFVWGVSTPSYQIEGASQADGRGPSIWNGHCKVPGHISNGETGDTACVRRSLIGWKEDPDAFRDTLIDVHRRYRLRVHVAENGAGYGNRFGPVYVDYATQQRIPTAAAHWYARMIHAEAMEAAR